MQDSYAAGLVDGEGYIGVAHIKAADTYAIRVAVAMVTKGTPILSGLHRKWGGRLDEMKPETERNVPKTRWVVDGEVAHGFLSSIAEHLILKREQALICLELHDAIRASRAMRGRLHWTEPLRAKADVAKRRIHDLNARGPQPGPPNLPPGQPVAVWRWGTWWDPNESLFGPVEFTGRIPVSGRMVAGHIYEDLPMSDWSRSSLLPTPTASDRFGTGDHGNGGADLRTTISLLPTPRATDGEKGGPNQRGSSGDLMLPAAVMLLPTPTATPYGNNQSPSPGAAVRPSLDSLFSEPEKLRPTPRASDGPDSTSHGRTWSKTDRSLHTLIHLGELGAPTNLPSDAGN